MQNQLSFAKISAKLTKTKLSVLSDVIYLFGLLFCAFFPHIHVNWIGDK